MEINMGNHQNSKFFTFKFSRKIGIYILSFLLLIYLFVGLLFYVGYSRPELNIPGEKYVYLVLTPVANALFDTGISKFYYLNSTILLNKRKDFSLSFSKNDLKKKDSIFNLIKSGDIRILESRHKKWRNFEIIHKNEIIKAKFKLHGSSPYPYVNGFESFEVESNDYINGLKKFKLITGLEMNYLNIFLNNLARDHFLISEAPGEIVVTNSMGEIRDFLQYPVFDTDYVNSEFNLSNSTILRRNTFDENLPFGQWHASNLDDVSYNLSVKSISKVDLDTWKSFQNDPFSIDFDKDYIASFLALAQSFSLLSFIFKQLASASLALFARSSN